MAMAHVIEAAAALAANHVPERVAVQSPQLAPIFGAFLVALRNGVVQALLFICTFGSLLTQQNYERPVTARKLGLVAYAYVHATTELVQRLLGPFAKLGVLCINKYFHIVAVSEAKLIKIWYIMAVGSGFLCNVIPTEHSNEGSLLITIVEDNRQH